MPISEVGSNYLSLFTNQLSTAEKADVYQRLAQLHATVQTPKERLQAIRFADQALECAPGEQVKCQMLILKGECFDVLAKNDLQEEEKTNRDKALLAYLEAVSIVISKLQITNTIPYPAVSRFDSNATDISEARRKKHQLEVDARKFAMEQNALLRLNKTIEGKLLDLYAPQMEAIDEIGVEGRKLGLDEKMLREMMARIKSRSR